MNKHQKLVQQQFLNNEEGIIKRLRQVYEKSYEDIVEKTKDLQDEINSIDAMLQLTDDEDEKAKLKSMHQSKVYQKQYQDAMKKQIGSILDNMQVEEFKTVSSYLNKCYEDGFIGSMYDLQGQGIPLCIPLDQAAMVRAVQIDSKISNGLYNHLGENVSLLKKRITAEVSRGIATGMSFQKVAQQLSLKMMGTYENPGGAYAYALRVARTEGHRIQCQATMDAAESAKAKGCDIVKQWDSTLDDSTRTSHQQVDGEIKEIKEKFSNGLMFPGDPSGGAAEVINCRCALLQRARWGLDEEELETLKERAAFYGLDKTNNFEEYKQKYLKMSETEKEHYKGLSALISGDGIEEHEEPQFLKVIDYKNKKEVIKELTNFEKSAIKEEIETACVITRSGEVFKCFGIKDHVYPDFDLKEKLRGATVSHNHPITETVYSFSNDDLDLFNDYELDILRGCDEEYTYEFSRTSSEIDDFPDTWQSEELFQHALMIGKAKMLGIGYRRWKNE